MRRRVFLSIVAAAASVGVFGSSVSAGTTRSVLGFPVEYGPLEIDDCLVTAAAIRVDGRPASLRRLAIEWINARHGSEDWQSDPEIAERVRLRLGQLSEGGAVIMMRGPAFGSTPAMDERILSLVPKVRVDLRASGWARLGLES